MGWVYEIDQSVEIAAPPDAVWARVSDHAGTPGWVLTGLRSVTLLEDGEEGPGTQGAVRGVKFAGWPVVQERVVRFEAPTRFQYKVMTGMPHLQDHLGEVSVAPSGTGSRLRWSIHFDFNPWNPLSWSAPVFIRGFDSVIAGGLAELKRQLEA